MFKKILVCLDGSDLAEQILPYAVEAARRFGSRVVLFEVTVPPSAVVAPSLGYYHATPLEKVQRDGEEAETYLSVWHNRYRRRG